MDLPLTPSQWMGWYGKRRFGYGYVTHYGRPLYSLRRDSKQGVWVVDLVILGLLFHTALATSRHIKRLESWSFILTHFVFTYVSNCLCFHVNSITISLSNNWDQRFSQA